MTETEANVLITLSPPAGDDPKPFHLRALGGRRGSSLSVQVSRMVEKGWVARQRIGGGFARSVFSYQITPAGAQALANHRACAAAAVHFAHCNQGLYVGSCKYGEPDSCPALRRDPVTTPEELDAMDAAEMLEGYRDGLGGDEEPGENRSKSYWHGWRNGHNDRAHTVDPAQRALITNLREAGRKGPAYRP
jgi:DNA-binding MarR family transcriptional regulator